MPARVFLCGTVRHYWGRARLWGEGSVIDGHWIPPPATPQSHATVLTFDWIIRFEMWLSTEQQDVCFSTTAEAVYQLELLFFFLFKVSFIIVNIIILRVYSTVHFMDSLGVLKYWRLHWWSAFKTIRYIRHETLIIGSTCCVRCSSALYSKSINTFRFRSMWCIWFYFVFWSFPLFVKHIVSYQ